MNDIYFIDNEHKMNYEKVTQMWTQSLEGDTEYQTACYILSVPMIFNKVEKYIMDFRYPVDWIWRWEWNYCKELKADRRPDEDEEDRYEVPYDLTGSMVHLGKFAMNMWNGYKYFNLIDCMFSLDEQNYKVLQCGMEMRKGKFNHHKGYKVG